MNSLPNDELSITISIPEACRMLGVSQSLGRQLAVRGEFPGAFKLGGRWLVHRQVFGEQVERLARSHPLTETSNDRLLRRAMHEAKTRLQSWKAGE